MSRDEASALPAFEPHEAGRESIDGKDTVSAHQRPLRRRQSQPRQGESLRPKTVLVMTGAAQARETGFHCVNMFANAGHRVIAVAPDGSAPEEFRKGPVADRIACLHYHGGGDALLRSAINALPERFHQIDALVGMVCIPAGSSYLLHKNARPLDPQPAPFVGDLVHGVRAVLPQLMAFMRGHALAVLLPEPGQRHPKTTSAIHREQADLLIARLRTELTELGVRFTRIQCGPLERNGKLIPGDITQAVAWALGQPHHLAVCDIDIQSAPMAQPALTRREREVLAWTACGKTSDEISQILDLSVSGVNFHITNFVSKLDSCNKTAAVARATQLGILP